MMKITTVGLLLMVATMPVWAAYASVHSDDEATTYVDLESMKSIGAIRRAWQITDLKKPDKSGNRSYRALVEFDCKERRARALQEDYFLGQGNQGTRTGGMTSPGSWTYIAPLTVSDLVLTYVCTR